MFRHYRVIFRELARYVPVKHYSNNNTQTVYTATIQTSCNNNHFITLDNFNVLNGYYNNHFITAILMF